MFRRTMGLWLLGGCYEMGMLGLCDCTNKEYVKEHSGQVGVSVIG
jgi:hypothetical protein